ncbi:MAG: hypothetical protein RL885_00355 [Planctomycetota bacterium]
MIVRRMEKMITADSDLRVICVSTPLLVGPEIHGEIGVTSVVTGEELVKGGS